MQHLEVELAFRGRILVCPTTAIPCLPIRALSRVYRNVWLTRGSGKEQLPVVGIRLDNDSTTQMDKIPTSGLNVETSDEGLMARVIR